MKKVLNLTLLQMVVNLSFGQVNLVPNPSFEDTVACPTLLGQVTKAKDWYNLMNTPDYFHSCSTTPQTSVPNNIGGFQYPHSGSSYMGVYTYSTVTPYREIIGAYLTSSLIVGQKYYVNFKVSMGYNIFMGGFNCATSGIGLKLSTTDFLVNPPPINNYTNIYCDTIIADTTNWTTIKGSFIADSAYTFISIGNFFDDQHSDTLHFGFWTGYLSYYYIDDVCISTDSFYSEVWTFIPSYTLNQVLQIYPNPISDIMHIVNIPVNAQQLDIVNLNGKIIRTIYFKHLSSIDVNLSNFSEGLYVAILRNREEIITHKKFIKSNN